jgi:hypothetical protein
VQFILQAQQPGRFTAEARKLAHDVLSSPYGAYLSATGRTALEFITGELPSPSPRGEAGTSIESLAIDLFPRPGAAQLGEVMVNNPDQDFRAAADITTQSETAVAGFGRTVVVAFNDSGQISTDPFGPQSFTGYSRSVDGGITFTDIGSMPPPPLGANFGDPGLVVDLEGNFYASALVGAPAPPPLNFQQTVGIYKSTNSGLTWSILATPPPSVTGSAADKPFIAVDTSSSSFAGNVYVSWTRFGGPPPPEGFPGLPIVFSRSTNRGLTFSWPIVISPSGDINQGSEPEVGPNGEVYVSWMRLQPSPQFVMMARSLNGGRTFTPATPVAPLTNIGFGGGTLNGNFRVLSWPRIDVSPANGNVYIVYASNPPGPDGADVFLITSADRGVTWSAPVRVNDDNTETDQFFPDVAVNSQGVVQVIWYDRRNDTDNRLIDVYRARISSNGRSVARNERVTSVSFPPAVGYDPLTNRLYMGDYIDIKPLLNESGRSVSFGAAWGDNRRQIITAGGRRNDQDVFFSRF